MVLSSKTLSELFPPDEPAFTPPFHVGTDDHGEVHIYDADDARLMTFCRVTQMPIGDKRALGVEITYWQAEANRLVMALNASYPKSTKED